MANKQKKPDQNQKNPLKTYARLSTAGLQMGAAIGLAAWGGVSLDNYYQTQTPVFTIVLTLVGIGAGLYFLFREIKNVTKD